jgi:hypothetical protein
LEPFGKYPTSAVDVVKILYKTIRDDGVTNVTPSCSVEDSTEALERFEVDGSKRCERQAMVFSRAEGLDCQ